MKLAQGEVEVMMLTPVLFSSTIRAGKSQVGGTSVQSDGDARTAAVWSGSRALFRRKQPTHAGNAKDVCL